MEIGGTAGGRCCAGRPCCIALGATCAASKWRPGSGVAAGLQPANVQPRWWGSPRHGCQGLVGEMMMRGAPTSLPAGTNCLAGDRLVALPADGAAERCPTKGGIHSAVLEPAGRALRSRRRALARMQVATARKAAGTGLRSSMGAPGPQAAAPFAGCFILNHIRAVVLGKLICGMKTCANCSWSIQQTGTRSGACAIGVDSYRGSRGRCMAVLPKKAAAASMCCCTTRQLDWFAGRKGMCKRACVDLTRCRRGGGTWRGTSHLSRVLKVSLCLLVILACCYEQA